MPNVLTLARIVLIPVLVLVYYLPIPHDHIIVTVVFVLAGLTDWLDGYLARRLNQGSRFGAFLDPVADKLMVAVALVLLVSDPKVMNEVYSRHAFALFTAVIIGREIAISALREWMAEIGARASVAVSLLGKVKTSAQMVAIGMLLFNEPLFGISMLRFGEVLLAIAALLTLWSMVHYLRAAWPSLTAQTR
jgi:CDP-diacylglycerol--glycerol-3-phosphate 3-phosphatidyltransferase